MNKLPIVLLLLVVSAHVINAHENVRVAVGTSVHISRNFRKLALKAAASAGDELVMPEARLLALHRGAHQISSKSQIHLLFSVPTRGDAEPDEKDYEIVQALRELDDLEVLIQGEEALLTLSRNDLLQFAKGLAIGFIDSIGNYQKCMKEIPAMITYFSQAASLLSDGWKHLNVKVFGQGLVALGKGLWQLYNAFSDCGVKKFLKAIANIAKELETGSIFAVIVDHAINVWKNKKEIAKFIEKVASAWSAKSWEKAGEALGYLIGIFITASGEGFTLPTISKFVEGSEKCVVNPVGDDLGAPGLLHSAAYFLSTGIERKSEDVVKIALEDYADAMLVLSKSLSNCNDLETYNTNLVSAYTNIRRAFSNDRVVVSFAENAWKMTIDGKEVGDIVADLSMNIIADQNEAAGKDFEKLVSLFA